MRVSNKTSRRFPCAAKALCEALEDRQLMSLTIELRNTDGTASATATSVGQVVTLDVLAVVSSAGNDPTQDGLLNLAGSFVSTAGGHHSVSGDLLATNLAPFNAAGTHAGTRRDLNADGNADVGSISPTSTTDYFLAQAPVMQGTTAGSIAGSTLVFNIATINYTVTRLNSGGQTSINFVPYVSRAADAATWQEDGAAMNNLTGIFQAGSAFVISDPVLVTPPVVIDSNAVVAENTSTNLYVLSSTDVIDPLDPSTLAVVGNPTHGTAVAVAEGSIIYTSFTNFTGNDSFTYTVADINGKISNTATLGVQVVSTPSPVAMAFTVNTFRNQTVNVNGLSHVTSTNAIDPTLQSIATGPAHGAATLQPDGTINYTPSENFVGTDSFQFIAGDSGGETSNPATVTVLVTASQFPVANDDSLVVAAGASVDANLQTNDTAGSAALVADVQLITQASHGTAVALSGGGARYTPTTGFSGIDSFTYADVDLLGNLSNTATVNVTVTAGTPPPAADLVAQVITGQSVNINVLANQTGAIPSTVAVATAPIAGIATVNADGTISYAPAAGFVGNDAFTYTFADTGGATSAPATVSVQIGTVISNVRGAAHSLRFTDAAGGTETLSLNVGSATIYFAGSGILAVPANGKANLSGAGTGITRIALSNTTRASALSIKGTPVAPVNVGGITDASPLGSIIAPSANITGDINLNGASAITVGNITNAAITIGSGVPNRFSLSAGLVSGSSLNSAVPNTSIKAVTWAGPITAPSINAISIKTGGLASNISTGAVGSISLGGNLTGNITGTAAKSIKITGDINGSTISIAGLLGQLKVVGSFTNTSITAGRISSMVLRTVTTNNGGKSFGINTAALGSFTGIFAGVPLHLGRAQLVSSTALQNYAVQRGAVFGDFAIQL